MILKNLETITEADLTCLVDEEAPESRTLEFKRKPIPKVENAEQEKKNKAELLKDVTAFANTTSGDLIYGIEETKGTATSLSGFEVENIDAEIRRMTDIIRNYSEPVLSNFHFWSVPLSSGKVALIVRVPRSWIGPHRVRINHKFFSRNSTGVDEMDIWELRTAFMSSNVEKEIKQFRVERLEEIQQCSAENPYPAALVGEGVREVLHLIPWSAFTGSGVLDIFDQRIQIFAREMVDWQREGVFSQNPNIDGLITYPSHSGSTGYTQLFRNGLVETVRVHSLLESGTPYIPSKDYERTIIEKLRRYLLLVEALNISAPLVVALSFTNTRNCVLHVGPNRGGSKGPLSADRIVVRDVIIDPFDKKEPSAVLKPVFDMVWNAFGEERSYNYDSQENWVGE